MNITLNMHWHQQAKLWRQALVDFYQTWFQKWNLMHLLVFLSVWVLSLCFWLIIVLEDTHMHLQVLKLQYCHLWFTRLKCIILSRCFPDQMWTFLQMWRAMEDRIVEVLRQQLDWSSMQQVECETMSMNVLAWFWVKFSKNMHESVFQRQSKLHESEGQLQFEVFENSRVYVFPNSTRNRAITY